MCLGKKDSGSAMLKKDHIRKVRRDQEMPTLYNRRRDTDVR